MITQGKHEVFVGGDSGWGSIPRFCQGRQAINEVIGPFGPAAPPAKFTAGNHMVASCRAIPGSPLVPLHVGIPGKKISEGVEGNVVRIPKAAGESLNVLS